jgi:hypothetical protein
MHAPLIVRPSFVCSLCSALMESDDPEEPTEPGGTELVVIENGKILPMHKDPNFFVFHSWADVPPGELPGGIDVEVSVWHRECFDNVYNEVDDSEHAISTRHCAMCDQDFDDNPYGNQITLGRIDLEEEVFMEDGSATPMKLCRPCLLKVLGEGDSEEGEVLLQNSLL